MGWSELIDWVVDSDDSYYEHLKKDYGEDAPVIHAIFDTAADTIAVTSGIGLISSIVGSKMPTSKEARDAIWEDRHEILAVGSAAPGIGTVISAVDSTLHAAESVENNVEFFVEGATGEDEPIYDENGNIIGWKDKWMTDEMQRKAYYAKSHGANATLGAVLTVTGGNYFKGGKAAITFAQKGGRNFVEKFFIKKIGNAADGIAENATKRAAAEAALQESANAVKTAEAKASQAAIREAEQRLLSEQASMAAKNATTNAVKGAAEQQAADHALYAGLERLTKEEAQREAEAAARQGLKAAAERDAAKLAEDAARNQMSRGIRSIDFLSSSNDLRSFLTTTVSIGLATVSEYNKNIDRMGVSDKYKAPTIPYIND